MRKDDLSKQPCIGYFFCLSYLRRKRTFRGAALLFHMQTSAIKDGIAFLLLHQLPKFTMNVLLKEDHMQRYTKILFALFN